VNLTTTDTTFTAFAICVQKPAGYTVVTVSDPIAADAQLGLRISCPGQKNVTGGGVFMPIGGDGLTINSSAPLSKHEWELFANNASTQDVNVTGYAVCTAPLLGFQFHQAPAVDNPPGAQTLGTISCPAGRINIGGGAVSSSASTAVDMNSSYPVGRAWDVYENNASASDETLTLDVLCALGRPRLSRPGG
jgi:hypothetical protein